MNEKEIPQGTPVNLQISFAVGPPNICKMAEDILALKIQCNDKLKKRIRSVAKAFIDETDELNRSLREFQTNATRTQLGTFSPPEMIEKAKGLASVVLDNEDHQNKIRIVAETYVKVAEHNHRAFEDFKRKYGHLFPPQKET